MLYRNWTDEQNEVNVLQLLLPVTKHIEVLKYLHDTPTGGHLSVEKTLDKVRQTFYWPNMKETVQKYCTKCDLCTSRKHSKESLAPMGTYIVGEPMEKIAIDILGPLPLTDRDNKYLLVVHDCFTKWVEAYPMPNQEAVTVTTTLVNEFICRYGTPIQILTDQGQYFESNIFQDTCKMLGIDKVRTSGLRPSSNGNVERINRTIGIMLTIFCEKKQKLWDTFVPQILMAYRSSIHSSTGKTPNKMVFGKEVTLPLQAVIPTLCRETDIQEVNEYVEILQKRFQSAHEEARKSLKKSNSYQKRHYDLRAKKRSLYDGQAVWVYEPTRKVGVCHKLTSKWKGPYIVTQYSKMV